jgi:hypothetical protein
MMLAREEVVPSRGIIFCFLQRACARGTARIEPGASTGNGSHHHRIVVTARTGDR